MGDVSGFDWYDAPQEKIDKELERLLAKNLVKKLEGKLYYYVYVGPRGRKPLRFTKTTKKHFQMQVILLSIGK